ncbi:MAG: TonB-dependent receptor [Opitutaceae bacterium]|nr:TonB-dependent receptor [Opitutaceae bacterium]
MIRTIFFLGRMLAVTGVVSACAVAAEGGAIAGRVVSAETGAAIAGASVAMANGVVPPVTTDVDGGFRLAGAPAAVQAITVTREGFQPTTVTGVAVTEGAVARVDVALAANRDPVIKMEAFSISADVVQNSGVGLLGARQKSIAVSDAIGADQMSKLGFGTAASAMKAVTGASVVGGKYVYIRGLGERYSSTQVNGVEVPSADPDRRAVNMDMFPSDLIDAIVTTKTFTPDKPGNFTGGAVDLKTKEFPDQFTASVSASLAMNSRVTGKDFLGSGGASNAWGRDDGSRALPAELASQRLPLRFSTATVDSEIGRLTRLFNPVMSPITKDAPFNRSFGAAVGGVAEVFGRRLGYAASLSYDRSFGGYRDGVLGRYERQGVSSPSLAPLVQLRDSRSEDDALLGAIANIAYQFSPEHQVSLNTMFNQAGNDMVRRQTGLNIAGGGISETEIFTTRTLRYTERALRSFQLAGKHLFPALRDARLNWSVTTATTSQEEPDTRYFSSFQTPDGSQFFEASGVPRPARYFRDLEESRDDASLDLTLPLRVPASGREAQLKFGGALARTDRTFNERLFEYNSTVLRYDGNEAGFLRESQVGQVDPATGRFRAGQLYLVETGSAGNNYLGTQDVDAYYGMADVPVTADLRFIGGVRRETTKLDVRSRDPRRRAGQLDNADTLPSASVIYALSDRMNVRLAATKTIARPNFREIADYTSFEFVGDFVYIGNPNLRRTTIKNYDLRWEWFPRRGEIVAVSLFHKKMTDPIERGVFSIVNSGELQYQNAPRGEVSGIEIEARKNFAFLSERLRGLSGGFNWTWVKSEVEITPAELALIRFYEPGAGSTRELTGQSPYIFNVDLTYNYARTGTTVSAYYNVFGERLSQVSPPGTPNVFEQPAPTLDVVWNQKIRQHWKLSVSAKNLLDRAAEETYTYRGKDYLRSSHRRGITTSLGLTYTY